MSENLPGEAADKGLESVPEGQVVVAARLEPEAEMDEEHA